MSFILPIENRDVCSTNPTLRTMYACALPPSPYLCVRARINEHECSCLCVDDCTHSGIGQGHSTWMVSRLPPQLLDLHLNKCSPVRASGGVWKCLPCGCHSITFQGIWAGQHRQNFGLWCFDLNNFIRTMYVYIYIYTHMFVYANHCRNICLFYILHTTNIIYWWPIHIQRVSLLSSAKSHGRDSNHQSNRLKQGQGLGYSFWVAAGLKPTQLMVSITIRAVEIPQWYISRSQ